MRRMIGALGATALMGVFGVGGAQAPSAADLVETARQDGRFGTLVQAIEAAGLAERLREPGPFTLFAPTDEAFADTPEDELRAGLAGDAERLQTLLLHHVVEGRLPSTALPPTLEPLAGDPLAVEFTGGRLTVASAGTDPGGPPQAEPQPATVVAADTEADNGLIHAIDTVLVPPALAEPPPPPPQEQVADAPPPKGDEPAPEATADVAAPPEPGAPAEQPAATPAPVVVVERPQAEPTVEVVEVPADEPPAQEPPPQADAAPPAEQPIGAAPPPPQQQQQQEAEPEPAPAQQQARLTEQPEPPAPAPTEEAPPPEVVSVEENLLGRTVRSSDGETDGVVADLVLSRQSGEIELVIVEVGGFFGLGRKPVAVPWDQVTFDGETDELVVELTQAELDEAPEFDYDALDAGLQERYVR